VEASLRRIFCFFLLLTACARPVWTVAQKQTKSVTDLKSLSRRFDYDANQPLDIQDKIVEQTPDAVIHDITYASPKGGRVPAYLITPQNSQGRFAAVLFGHYGLGTRSEFIPEAKFYAKAGVVSLIPDYPWDRPEPWRRSVDHFDKPELDRETYIQTVIDLRRGMDLLLARGDVDPKRIAYIGHSYGAQWGSILSAIDQRMKTSVLMAGVAETADVLLLNQDPGLVELRKNQPPGQLEKYILVNQELDAIHFVGHAAPVALLLQFANYEHYFDKTSMQHYIDAASEPKKVMWYDTGHELNDPQALRDRYDWLVKQLGLKANLQP
jgi:dienelactone hydrolase